VFLNTFDATNSAVIDLKGTAEPGSTIYLTQNTTPEGDVVTTEDGIFEFGSIHLSEGQNVFSAVAIDSSGNKSLVSDQSTITYSKKAPNLNLTTPTDKQVITGSNPGIQVQGSTDPDVRLTINDRVVIVGSDGTFNYKFVLNQGDNLITFIAINEVGNSVQKQLTVTYSP
jgi:bacillopeptidase F